jgi:hypothetical protein
VNVDVVAIEADDVHFSAVGRDEGREDLAADSFDVFLRVFVHVFAAWLLRPEAVL